MKAILSGATGNHGKKIAEELKQQGYEFSVVVRNRQKANELIDITDDYVIADVTNASSLKGISNAFDVVISSLGKSAFLFFNCSISSRLEQKLLNCSPAETA